MKSTKQFNKRTTEEKLSILKDKMNELINEHNKIIEESYINNKTIHTIDKIKEQ
jgi:hypothetical protein